MEVVNDGARGGDEGSDAGGRVVWRGGYLPRDLRGW
jgi:hypothetical protein